MRIQLLIAVEDLDYTEHLSRVLLDKYQEMFEVSVCSDASRLEALTCERKFDVLLADHMMLSYANLNSVRLPLLLWDVHCELSQNMTGVERVRKYQRISNLTGEIIEHYAEIGGKSEPESGRAHVTAVWSPCGGCGKTTVALAWLKQKVAEQKKGLYLDLEPFSSIPVYFSQSGKSISSVLEKLDHDVDLLLKSIRMQDHDSGIYYFGRPDNYDDMSILTQEEIVALIKTAAKGVDELVVDLGSHYDSKVSTILDLADTVMLVADQTKASQIKLEQFCSQHDLYEMISVKSTLVMNRGARSKAKLNMATVSLPVVQSEDPVHVYKTLSAGYF